MIDPATFGILVARQIKENPWSSNWSLVGQALENAGYDLEDVMKIGEIVNHVAAQELPK